LRLFNRNPVYRWITWPLAGVLPLLPAGCGDPGATSEFAPVYVAAAYGTVTTAGIPAGGVSIQAHVYQSACEPELRLIVSESFAETNAAGDYRVLLHSNDSAAGQCVVLGRSDTGDSVSVSLAGLSFTAQEYEEPRDSIRIDLAD
jgi:hypothetical protein